MISYEELSLVFDMDNPLTLEYFEICSNLESSGSFERHHILPISISPQYAKELWNIVPLSYQNHYNAHKLLPQILVLDTHRYSMLSAWHLITHTREGLSISANEYALLKEKLRESKSIMYSGINHPQYGVPRSKETKEKLAIANTGENSHRFGTKHTEVTRNKMRSSKTGRKMSPEACKNIGLSKLGIPQKPEHKKKISDALKGKPKSKEHIINAADAARMYSYAQYSKDGAVLIKIFTRMSEVVSAGFSQPSVTSVCNGRVHSHGGFHWKKIPKITNADETSQDSVLEICQSIIDTKV